MSHKYLKKYSVRNIRSTVTMRSRSEIALSLGRNPKEWHIAIRDLANLDIRRPRAACKISF